jgi:hypothetical protein
MNPFIGKTLTLEALTECRFTLLGDEDPKEILRDKTRTVVGENGKPFHPPILDALGRTQQLRVRTIAMKKGDKISLEEKYFFGLFQTSCGCCPQAKALQCRDFAHAEHWTVVGGTVSPRQVRCLGIPLQVSPEMTKALEQQDVLEAEARAAATPMTRKK